MGDGPGAAAAVDRFIAVSDTPTAFTDVTLGRAGSLLGCALLVEALGGERGPGARSLVAFGDRVAAEVAGTLARCPRELSPGLPATRLTVDGAPPSLADAPAAGYIGIAHGEAGLLYALLRWRAAAERPVTAEERERLLLLTGCASPTGRGLAWPSRKAPEAPGDPVKTFAGWCNGSAGLLHLWTLAHTLIGGDALAAAAEGAAWHAWESGGRPRDLCCGLGGRAYALLEFARHSGEAGWVSRATRLANLACEGDTSAFLAAESLYRGRVGLALLAADLEEPARACMPLFGREGWPRLATF